MKKSRYLVTAAAALWMAIGLGMTAQAKSTYMLEIANQYDSEETSRDDNDRNKVHPLEPDVYVEDASSDTIEQAPYILEAVPDLTRAAWGLRWLTAATMRKSPL